LHAAAPPLVASVRTTSFLPAVGSAQAERAGFDVDPQLFQMIQNVTRRLAGKQDGKFLTAATVSLSSTGDPCQARRDHAQNLVSGVVTIRVIAALEVVNVDHRNRIRRCQSKQRIVKSAAGRQRGQLVVISQQVRSLDDRAGEDECPGGEVSGRNSSHTSRNRVSKINAAAENASTVAKGRCAGVSA